MHDNYYMQVTMRIYKNGVFYDEFVFNVLDEMYQTTTDLIRAKFILNNETDVKSAEVIIDVFEDDYTIAMLIPVHHSQDWEITTISEKYTVGFYCTLP